MSSVVLIRGTGTVEPYLAGGCLTDFTLGNWKTGVHKLLGLDLPVQGKPGMDHLLDIMGRNERVKARVRN
jgi:hypothetical protein